MDEHGTWTNKRRGVAVYASSPTAVRVAIPDFPKVEAGVVLTEYTDYVEGGMKTKNIAYFCIYRNIHAESDGATMSDIILFVRTLLARFHSMGIQECVIAGDFNFEGSIDFGFGTKELRDPDLYHKHNSTSRNTRIDRVFTNADHAKIIHVFKTVENKLDYTDENGNIVDDCGHKPFLIKVGRDKKECGSSSFSCKRLKKLVAKFKVKKIKEPENDTQRNETAEYFINTLQGLGKLSTTFSKRKSSWKPDELAMEMLERAGDNIWKRKDAAKSFYSLAEDFMGKVQASEEGVVPPLAEFKDFHEQKLTKIIPPDIEKCEKVMKDIYGGREKVQISFPSKKEFKKIIMRSSNSGALDFYGTSLKQAKIMFKHNKDFFTIYYYLCKSIAKSGHIPWLWKKDKITFLFKSKGTRDNPKFYRPITIACSFGKMFDRVLMDRWSRALDFNFDNHAYKTGCSCTSAIADLQNYLKDIRIEASCQNLNLLTFICAEDISAAFESIAHKIIKLYSELTFESLDFNMPKLTESYLDRKSFVTDRKATEFLEVVRKFSDQTSPQGSSNSPPWWRVYDGGFSKIFKNLLNTLKLSNNLKIHDIFHVSYADDHLIAITLDLGAFEDDLDVQNTIIELSNCIRQDLIKATKTFGCAIAPTKSEVLVPRHLKSDPKDKSISPKLAVEFTWLGYSLEISANFLKFTPTRMTSRFHTTFEKFHSMCQYIKSVNVKRKVYQVYVSPVIDWFIPTILVGKQHELSASNEIEKFQQKCLAVVAGVCGNVSRTELNDICGIRSTRDNCIIVAGRLAKFYKRDIDYLKGEQTSARMVTRSRNVVRDRIWKNIEFDDIGDKINFINQNKPAEMREVPIFSQFKAKRWAKIKNVNIRYQINRRNGTLDQNNQFQS